MKNNVCVNCNSEDIRKGVLVATVAEVYLYQEETLFYFRKVLS